MEKIFLDVSNLTVSLEETTRDFSTKTSDIQEIHSFTEIKNKLEKLKESIKHQSQYQEEKFKAQKLNFFL